MKVKSKIILAGLCLSLSSCVTLTEDNKNKKPPLVYGDMPIEEMVEAAIDFGDYTLIKVKKIIRKTNQFEKAAALAKIEIIDNYQTLKSKQLVSAVNLYHTSNPAKPYEIFDLLVNSDRKLARDLAWIIASELPSKKMQMTIDDLLTLAIEEDELEELYSPQMAGALAHNRSNESYTIVLNGLYKTNEINFARALIDLNPRKASDDFLKYLSQVESEELRQLTLNTLDPMTCLLILNHFERYPVEISHPNFSHLFFYAASRNLALAKEARIVIQKHLPQRTFDVAQKLARMPAWVQVSYINNVSKNMAPIIKVLMQDLRKISAKREVIDEINTIRF